ncbi:hypothetical protein cd3_075 [Carnobacterium phage cd3]|uniref:Uncharacterized protein n=1 Tax=Carnobacterium phage cd2 TaxID=2849244 RepID=A0AAE7SQW8_9CAUD|nr:hypothetical protein PQD68_gp075 [Carnobacterium phage cd2]QXP45201.1 hypothetical protein cd2_075 [Carnobacterium phage cd2]QXP45244.1 hypothetical protein cd3_075 [Carnobacterium phage cd3]
MEFVVGNAISYQELAEAKEKIAYLVGFEAYWRLIQNNEPSIKIKIEVV